jgi:hypothetical protein
MANSSDAFVSTGGSPTPVAAKAIRRASVVEWFTSLLGGLAGPRRIVRREVARDSDPAPWVDFDGL